jgi:hypothetical protein
MAILDELPGIEVAVCIDEQQVHEYFDDEFHTKPHVNTVSTYIESETSREFAVKIIAKEPYALNCPTLGFQIFVDGVKVREPVLTQTEFERCGRKWEIFLCGIKYATEGQNCILRPFRFSKIDTCQ